MNWLHRLATVFVANSEALPADRALRRQPGDTSPRLTDTALAVAAAGYAVMGAAPLLRHLPFLYDSFPAAALVAVLAGAGGCAVLILRFLM